MTMGLFVALVNNYFYQSYIAIINGSLVKLIKGLYDISNLNHSKKIFSSVSGGLVVA